MEQEIEEVSRREEWYRTAVETGEDVLFEYDSEKDVFTSYELLEKEGRRTAFRKEFANYEYHLTHSDMVYPDDVELVRKIICRGEFVPAEIRMHTPWDGDDYVWYYVRGRAYKKTNGYVRVVGTLRNIDKTKKQEEQYILLRDRFSIAVRNTYDRVLEVNYKKNEVYSLELSERGLDKVRCSATAGEFMDYFINHRLHPSQRASFREYEQNADKYLREGSIYDEWQVLGEDGQYHWEGIYCLASEWEEGTYLNFVKNIDEVKKKEEQARRNLKDALASAEQANMAKRDFLSRMSHDIRTPMNAIVGMVAIAASHIEEKQQVQDCLAKITVSAKHLIGLINDILDMSRIESGKMMLNEENFNIAEQIQDLIVIIQPQVKEKGQELEVSLGTIRSENLIGDTLRVQQLLLNIVSNAVKYTAEGGKITICINELECRYSDTAKFEISVEDNGIGMTEEFQRRLFQPFEQEKTEYLGKVQGTGLGMAITKNIVDMMNGTIEVKSTPGKGSKFTVTLFFKKQEKSAGEYGDELEGLRALVVDDDLDVCESTCAILEELGMDSEWVQTGREAVNRVILAQEAERSYNTVLVDWQMPEMNGLETAAAIRSRLGDEIPIIIITAYDWSDIEEEARRAGVTAFIPKPLFKSNLYRTIRDWNGYRQNEVRPMLTEKEVYEGRRFLLVEDNELNREIGRELLEITGAQVDCAANGREAVDMLQQAEPGTYDIVLMDIQMPVMNGYEAAEHIRNSGRKDLETLPIFAMTANAFTEDIQRARRAGMNEHLAKPLDINYLYRILQKYLENPGTLI